MRRQATSPQASAWVRAVWSEARPKTNSLIITLYGDVIAPHGGAMRLSDLVNVLAPFGVNERLVRTCVYRLAQDGWLESRRLGRRSVYTLTPHGMQRFQRAYRRVYSEQQRQWTAPGP